jgi:hypothetical protein
VRKKKEIHESGSRDEQRPVEHRKHALKQRNKSRKENNAPIELLELGNSLSSLQG